MYILESQPHNQVYSTVCIETNFAQDRGQVLFLNAQAFHAHRCVTVVDVCDVS